MINIRKINSKIKRLKYIARSKKISSFLRKILKNERIGIVDVGAGHRYLPVLLNFDGVSKIAMVDPNKSLEWSFHNFRKIIKYSKNLFKFNFGISDKTLKKKYFVTKVLTGSTFHDVYKTEKKNNLMLDEDYFGDKNFRIHQVYSFKDFVKKFFKYKIDIVKIDVEGDEVKIVSSVLKSSNPLLIEVETNLNNEIYPNSFNKINSLLIQKKYRLVTAYPIFLKTGRSDAKQPFKKGNYDNPIIRNPLEQFECIYIKDKKKYDAKDLSIFLGYGLLNEVINFMRKSKNTLSNVQKQYLEDAIKKLF